MNLQTWLANGWLRPHQTDIVEIRDLWLIAGRDLRDAESGGISFCGHSCIGSHKKRKSHETRIWPPGVRIRSMRRRRRSSFFFVSSCSQTRSTLQPILRSIRLTIRSRVRLPAIFFCQNAAFPLGWMKCLGHPCQKHPSTNTASLLFGNTKSGEPNTG